MNYRNTVTVPYRDTYVRVYFKHDDGRVRIDMLWFYPSSSYLRSAQMNNERDKALVLTAYRKLAKKYRVRYASFFGLEFVNEFNVLGVQAIAGVSENDSHKKSEPFNYYIEMWSRFAQMKELLLALAHSTYRHYLAIAWDKEQDGIKHRKAELCFLAAQCMGNQVEHYFHAKPFICDKSVWLGTGSNNWSGKGMSVWMKKVNRFLATPTGRSL